jgi:preprotein translocase subunit SecF
MTQATQYTNFDFMGKSRFAVIFSTLLLIASLGSLLINGLNLGIDFTSGTLVEVGYQQPVDLGGVRMALADSAFSDTVVQYYGSAREVMVRVPLREGLNSAEISNELLSLLRQSGQEVELLRVDFVGPQVGEELKEDGGLAMLAALAMILVYIAIRFQLRFSVGAITALVHDVIITIGFFSISRMEFDLTVLAAILAVIGYSLNDTIVVFDRIRENFQKMRKIEPLMVINVSLNQTFSRTLITSLTTLLVLIALFIFGGETIHAFATALIVGVLIGTYSSIFVASPVILALGVSKQDLMPVEKEDAAIDSRP